MSILLTIIVFIVVFSILILVHEFGHFIMAKRAGIKVEEFGLGLPPRIWGKKKGDTLYSINWIPFGGFVRMLGEDATDPSMMKKKRSFIAQPMRARVKVIIAGVVMNFLLAWLLLSIGFTVGMEPLLAPGDVLNAVDTGLIELEQGAKIKSIEQGSFAEQMGFKAEDILYSINGEVVNDYDIAEMFEDPSGAYKVVRDGEILSYEVLPEQVAELPEEFEIGLGFYDFGLFPRVRVFDLDTNSKAYRAGMREGDYILQINEQQIYSVIEFEQAVRGISMLEYEVYRDGMQEVVIVEFDQIRKVIISEVIPETPADEVGLKDGDVIISVNGIEVKDSLELIGYVEEHTDEKLAYLIERQGDQYFYEIKPEEGRIGVYLSELMDYGAEQEMSVYNASLLSSVVAINDQKYPWYVSIYKSFGEGFRLAKLTGAMFLSVVADIVRGGEVPDTVAGPVGIAHLTHIFVQEGFISVLRFVAILSLSLAVINILPFPALDGGRLLFIIIEFIIGRRVNQKWEAYIHALGYILILMLILAITYSDIMKFF
jgi:regulator of sigma E protease